MPGIPSQPPHTPPPGPDVSIEGQNFWGLPLPDENIGLAHLPALQIPHAWSEDNSITCCVELRIFNRIMNVKRLAQHLLQSKCLKDECEEYSRCPSTSLEPDTDPPPVITQISARLLGLKEKDDHGTSLVVQWLRLHASTAGDTGSIPGQGTKILHYMQCTPPPKKRTRMIS